MMLLLWRYSDVILYYCDIILYYYDIILYYCLLEMSLWCYHGIWHHNRTIWHHNSNTIPETVEHGMVVNYQRQSSNICIHKPMGFIHKHLTYNKANIDLWCRAIWVLWIFGNNIDSALPQSILLHHIHKIPFCPHHRSIFV